MLKLSVGLLYFCQKICTPRPDFPDLCAAPSAKRKTQFLLTFVVARENITTLNESYQYQSTTCPSSKRKEADLKINQVPWAVKRGPIKMV